MHHIIHCDESTRYNNYKKEKPDTTTSSLNSHSCLIIIYQLGKVARYYPDKYLVVVGGVGVGGGGWWWEKEIGRKGGKGGLHLVGVWQLSRRSMNLDNPHAQFRCSNPNAFGLHM